MADTKETEIEVVSAPAGYDKTDYQFFLNKNTGQIWKAAVIIQPAYSPIVNGDVEAAATQLAVQISVSPVDDAGKALREGERPIIIDVLSHTFNHVEMSEVDFDPLRRIMTIIAERIHIGECQISGAKQIRDIGEAWSKKAKVPFKGTAKYIEPETAQIAAAAPTVITATGEPVTANQPLVGFNDGSTVVAPTPQGDGSGPPASDTDTGGR